MYQKNILKNYGIKIGGENMCDICLHSEGQVKKFVTFQPTTQKEEIHFVCEKCINQLVNKYFSKVNML